MASISFPPGVSRVYISLRSFTRRCKLQRKDGPCVFRGAVAVSLGLDSPLLNRVSDKCGVAVDHMGKLAIGRRDEQAGDRSQVDHQQRSHSRGLAQGK